MSIQRMPIGIDDFKKLVEAGYFFADKSKFIVDLIDNRAEVTLITRPRRFGKTLNLSMLRYFFDVERAEENRNLFANLAVNDHPDAMKTMGQYPVLMLSLKSVKSSNLEDQLNDFKTVMKKLYSNHAYLYDHLSANEKISFDRVCQRNIDASELATSLEELIQFIARYRKKPVVVLLDEYDQPLLSAYYGGFEKNFQLFYRKFLGNALKGNRAVQFAVITGVMQMAGSGLFSDFNNADMYTILDERFATAFGFTEKDVQSLLQSESKQDKSEEVKRWYNGYLYGKQQHVMYNPWSVLTYVSRDYEPDAYWAHTSDNALLQKELHSINDTTCAKFTELMAENGKICVTLPKHLRFSEVAVGQETALWVLLLSSGYLKAHVEEGAYGPLVEANLYIPNEEVRFIYHYLFHGWLVQRLGIIDNSASMLTHLTRGEVDAFCQELETYFLESVSVYDVQNDAKESFYHGFVSGLLAMINQTHTGRLRSNVESGLGRFDITLEPKNPQMSPGIVFELKRLDKKNGMGKTEAQVKELLTISAREGLTQIKTKAYGTDLIARGVQKIAYISLAFSGKQMAYQCEGPVVIEKSGSKY